VAGSRSPAGSSRGPPPNFLPIRSNSIAANTSPTSVGMTTIAMIMATLLEKDCQNTWSWISAFQLVSPIQMGGRMPRYDVKLR